MVIMSEKLSPSERIAYAISLAVGPALFTAADFFWVSDGQYGLTAGTLLTLGSVFWVGGFAGIAAVIRPHSPRVAGWGMLLGAYGAVCGGAAFGLQGMFNAMYDITHSRSLDALGQHPVVANLIFWIGGPAFPVTLLLLAVYLLATRRAPRWVSILLLGGAILFPVARIPRIELIAHGIDLLLLIPATYLAIALARTGTLTGSRLLPSSAQPKVPPIRRLP